MEIAFTAQQIRDRVHVLAQQINRDYAGHPPVVIVNLNGAFMFAADLLRELTMPVRVVFSQTHAYQGRVAREATVQVFGDFPEEADLLVVEDIVDTGQSAAALLEYLERTHTSVALCALLDKPSARAKYGRDPEYVGFEIPATAGWLVGYGLDISNLGRELPDLWYLQPGETLSNHEHEALENWPELNYVAR